MNSIFITEAALEGTKLDSSRHVKIIIIIIISFHRFSLPSLPFSLDLLFFHIHGLRVVGRHMYVLL